MNARCAFPILIVLTILAFLPVRPACALGTHTRADKTWMLGLSWGVGQSHFTQSDGFEQTLKRGAAPQIRFGRVLSPHFLASLEYEGWLFEDGDVAGKFRRSFQAATIALSWFPGGEHPGWGGLYLRTGAGLGWGSLALIDLERNPETGDLEQTNSRRIDDPGLGLVFGLGYEFRLLDRFAVGVAATASYLSLNGDIYDDAWTYPVSLSLAWYW